MAFTPEAREAIRLAQIQVNTVFPLYHGGGGRLARRALSVVSFFDFVTWRPDYTDWERGVDAALAAHSDLTNPPTPEAVKAGLVKGWLVNHAAACDAALAAAAHVQVDSLQRVGPDTPGYQTALDVYDDTSDPRRLRAIKVLKVAGFAAMASLAGRGLQAAWQFAVDGTPSPGLFSSDDIAGGLPALRERMAGHQQTILGAQYVRSGMRGADVDAVIHNLTRHTLHPDLAAEPSTQPQD